MIPFMIGCTKFQSEAETQPQDNNSVILKNPRKGACITTKNTGWDTKIKNLNASWHHSWGAELNNFEPESVEFVPMIWSMFNGMPGFQHVKPVVHWAMLHYLMVRAN
jgi:hypothetical protein